MIDNYEDFCLSCAPQKKERTYLYFLANSLVNLQFCLGGIACLQFLAMVISHYVCLGTLFSSHFLPSLSLNICQVDNEKFYLHSLLGINIMRFYFNIMKIHPNAHLPMFSFQHLCLVAL